MLIGNLDCGDISQFDVNAISLIKSKEYDDEKSDLILFNNSRNDLCSSSFNNNDKDQKEIKVKDELDVKKKVKKEVIDPNDKYFDEE